MNNKKIKLTFPKKLRLLNNKKHQLSVKKIFTSYINIFVNINYLNYPRLGMFLSKKNIKLANDRNRIKRIVKENFRINQFKISYLDFFLYFNGNIMQLNNEEIKKKIDKIWF